MASPLQASRCNLSTVGATPCVALFAVVIVLVLLVSASASAESPPTIEFVYPHANDVITDYPIHIETKVTNCILEPPVQYWSAVEPADARVAHIHYTLDNSPIFATKSTQVVMDKPPGKSLPLGKHVLRAELVLINHEHRNPPIYAEIPIVCERPGQKAGSTDAAVPMDDRTRRELQEVEKQLTEVQQQITQLKSQARQVPNP